jgi:predicted kinase
VIAYPAAASHLADLDARVESHLGAIRLRADQLRERLGDEAAALRAQLAPPEASVVLDAPLLADVPLLGPDA